MMISTLKRVLPLLLTTSCFAFAQKATPPSLNAYDQQLCVAFYNVENLFDTINQPGVIDEEFTPRGLNRWTQERYQKKLHNMSNAIKTIGIANGPDILGLAEVENRGVLEDLIKTPALAPMEYDIVHYDSPDARGIDCAMIYKKSKVSIISSRPISVTLPNRPKHKTRDILYVKARTGGEDLHIMVAHWPSRYGGEKASMPGRLAAAKVMKSLCDSVMSTDQQAKIIMMGDLNDDPISPSLKMGLDIKYKANHLQASDIYTPMYDLYKAGFGTLAYRDAWNIFDIMMVNGNLINADHTTYRIYQEPRSGFRAFINNASMLTQESGRYAGYPKRTIVGGQFMDGYSDHFPVYLILVK